MCVAVTDVGLLLVVMQGVFSRDWLLTAPRRIASISGSCVTVPCHFQVPDDYEADILNCSNSAHWRRGTHLTPGAAQGEIIGNLTQKNCTTVLSGVSNIHSDVYFFRLDCPKFKFTFKDGINISTQTEPSPPQLSVVGQGSEGVQARLQCETPVSCSALPPSLTWFPRDASSREESHMQQSADGLMTMTSTLTFMASADHHNQSILCSVSYPLATGGRSSPAAASRRLSILYAPRFTRATISPSGPVFQGETVTLTCSSDANPPVTRYTWFREGRVKMREIAQGRTLDLQVSLSDRGAYLCRAQSPRGSQKSASVFLEVDEAQAAGHSDGLVMMPYILCGVVSVLYVLTVLVDLYKYRSLSRRLKKIELKGEDTYTDLKTNQVNSDYDRLQLKPKPPPEVPDYENSSSMMQLGVTDPPQPDGR